MKLKSKSSKKKIILITAGVVLLALAGTAFAIYGANQEAQQTQDTAQFQDANPISGESKEKQQSHEDEHKEHSADSHNDAAPDTSLNVTFTSVFQMDSVVRVRAEVDALIEGGTCKLTLVKGSSIVTKTAATYPTANVSTCQGFDVATSELASGTWDVTLEITKDTQSGKTSTTVDVT